jgi:hypothetical protein
LTVATLGVYEPKAIWETVADPNPEVTLAVTKAVPPTVRVFEEGKHVV